MSDDTAAAMEARGLPPVAREDSRSAVRSLFRMRMRRLSSWLVPTFGGSLASAAAATTLAVIFGPVDPLLGNRFWNWVASMMLVTPLTLLLATILVATDVTLLRWRSIPVGRRAWWLSAVAPLLVGAAYELHRPGQHDFGLWFVVALIAPMVVSAFLTRWIGGKRTRVRGARS
jgi:hypothetical protein